MCLFWFVVVLSLLDWLFVNLFMVWFGWCSLFGILCVCSVLFFLDCLIGFVSLFVWLGLVWIVLIVLFRLVWLDSFVLFCGFCLFGWYGSCVLFVCLFGSVWFGSGLAVLCFCLECFVLVWCVSFVWVWLLVLFGLVWLFCVALSGCCVWLHRSPATKNIPRMWPVCAHFSPPGQGR